MGKVLQFEEERLVELPLADVWEIVSDSNHFNHYIDLFPVQFGDFKREDTLYRPATAKALGLLPIQWKEHPFTWVRHEWFEVERVYEKSPIERALWRVTLREQDEQTVLLKISGHFTYANLLGKIALQKVVIPQLYGMFPYVEEAVKNRKEYLPRPQAKQKITIDQPLLTTRQASLLAQFTDRQLIDELIKHIQTSNDEDVVNMRPYRWARERNLPKEQVLHLFLMATKAGLLQQKWSMLCPNCRVPKKQTTLLRDVSSFVHCDLCGIDFSLDFDRSIEMQFDVHEAIRTTSSMVYCINGPMNSQHVLAQFRIPAGETVRLSLPEWRQPYRYRLLQLNDTIEVGEGYESVDSIIYDESGFSHTTVVPSSEVHLTNQAASEIVFMIEEVMWSEDALTARELTSLQLFRDLFATEVLSPGLEIQVGNIAILFTDLKASTALYERVGDALAYTDVREHFQFLKEHITQHQGAIVKTIGDSVMAVFKDSRLALEAAIAIQRSIDELLARVKNPVAIKIGLHYGPAIAVNANDLLDYFGRTINIAARMQQLSNGHDIVMAKDVFEEISSNSPLLDGIMIEHVTAEIKGIDKEMNVVCFICKN